MPSETVIVLNKTLFAPAPSAPALAWRANPSMCMLHGVTIFQVDAIPTWGLAKSSSLKPTARNMARLGACVSPSTTTRECRRGSTPGGSWSCFAIGGGKVRPLTGTRLWRWIYGPATAEPRENAVPDFGLEAGESAPLRGAMPPLTRPRVSSADFHD